MSWPSICPEAEAKPYSKEARQGKGSYQSLAPEPDGCTTHPGTRSFDFVFRIQDVYLRTPATQFQNLIINRQSISLPPNKLPASIPLRATSTFESPKLPILQNGRSSRKCLCSPRNGGTCPHPSNAFLGWRDSRFPTRPYVPGHGSLCLFLLGFWWRLRESFLCSLSTTANANYSQFAGYGLAFYVFVWTIIFLAYVSSRVFRHSVAS
jgi:hypothetical protein